MSRSGWRRRWGGRDDCGALDDVEFGEAFVEVGLPGFFDLVLVDAGVIAVLVVEHFDDFHTIGVDGAKGSEAGFVEEGIVFEIDEDLRGAGVWAGGGEDDGALFVGLSDGIVFEFGLFPGGADGGIRTNAELRDKAGNGAEDDGVVIEVVLDEIVEAICAEGRPCTSDGDGEVAAGGDEFDDVDVGSFVFEQRWVKEHAVVGGVRRGGGRRGLFRSGRAAL